MVACHTPLPAFIKKLSGDCLTRIDGGMKWSKHAIYVFGANCFGWIVFEEVIASGQTADDDDVSSTRSRHGCGNF
jgi:hypothetical protein